MLKEQIKILSKADAELLRADKLSKRYRNQTGYYLTIESGKYTAYDYSERQSWKEYFGSYENAPEGWSKEFDNPLDAIDWLLK
jgi:hypothetical protein